MDPGYGNQRWCLVSGVRLDIQVKYLQITRITSPDFWVHDRFSSNFHLFPCPVCWKFACHGGRCCSVDAFRGVACEVLFGSFILYKNTRGSKK